MSLSAIGPDELAQSCWKNDPVTVAYGASTTSSQLTAGKFYYVVATTACNFKQGTSAVTATTSSNYLPAGMMVTIRVTDATANGYVAFIAASGSSAGTAFLMTPSAP